MKDTAHKPETSKGQAVVLIVDDEAVVTQSLTSFLELETDYRVLQSQSPTEALALIRETPVDLVIADFLMPEMNGLQFLTAVKKLYPDVPRIMLTGYADKENSIRAINEVGLFQYIEKPWDNDQFLLVIRNAIRTKSLQETLSDRIREMDRVLRERDHLLRRDEIMRSELLLARRLQESLLPDSLPNKRGISFTATYLPALDVGGDFYDVIPLANDQTAVLVADATGHGIQAALSTAILKFAFSRYKNSPATPGEILTGMNRVLGHGLPKDTYVAAMVLAVDMTTARCVLANAGIPHPFLLHRSDPHIERIIANGFMLGMLDDELYHPDDEIEVQLTSGDFLLLYTDGISEPQNERGEQFEDSAFKQVLASNAARPAQVIANELVEGSRKFTHKDHEWDDITMVGVELE